MDNLYQKLLVVGFLILIFGFFVLGIILPDQKISQDENRALAQFPKISMEAIFSGKLSEAAEKYFNDQFPFRSNWITAKSGVDYLQGKKDSAGVYFAKDNYLLQKLETTLNDTTAEGLASHLTKNLDGLESFLAKHPNYYATLLLIPTSTWILQDKLPKYATAFDEKYWADFVETAIKPSEQLKFTTAFNPLFTHKSEEIFYRTDHHYTGLGAYYTYEALGEVLGYEPLAKSDFEIQKVSQNFYGTLYSKGIFAWYPQDTISIFEKSGLAVKLTYVDDGTTLAGLYDFSKLATKDQYSMFLGGNYGYIKLETNVKNGKTLNIVKDSFAHALVPFLANHYENINIFDLRYYRMPFDNFLDAKENHEFLFLYNMATYLQEGTIFEIKYL